MATGEGIPDRVRELVGGLGPAPRSDDDLRAVEEAIGLLDPQGHRELVALLYGKLSGYYRSAAWLDRGAALDAAVAAGERAVELTMPDDPVALASAVVQLAQALQERGAMRPDAEGRDADFVRAERLCRARLDADDLPPSARGGLYDALGSAFLDRPGGDRIENVERAIAAYDEGLDAIDDPMLRAFTVHNLGRAWMMRLRGDRTENLDRAIAALSTAFEMGQWIAAEDDGILLKESARTLGVAYLQRGSVEEQDVLHGVGLLQFALSRSDVESEPFEFATMAMNLGTGFATLSSDADARAAAISHFEMAARVYDVVGSPFAAARARRNLANLLAESTDETERRRAVELLGEALEVYTAEADPVSCRVLSLKLALLLHDVGDAAGALDRVRAGIAAGEELYRRGYAPESRREESALNTELYDLYLELGSAVGEPATALLLASEAARARRFLDELSQRDAPVPDEVPRELARREAKLLTKLRRLEARAASSTASFDDARAVGHSIERTRRLLGTLWDEMSVCGSRAREYAAMRRGGALTWERVSRLAAEIGPAGAIVSLYVLATRTLVFVVRDGWTAPTVHVCPLGREDLETGYVPSCLDEVVHATDDAPPPTGAWRELGDALLGEALAGAEDAEFLCVCPHGVLHGVPLHALSIDGVPLIERYAVSYAPSIGILSFVSSREDRRDLATGALVGSFTDSADAAERAEFEAEASAVAARLGVETELRQTLDAAVVREALATRAVVHLACHGYFDDQDPLGSGIMLADGALTARTLLAADIAADLVTLSACETGVVASAQGDELTGLQRALLLGGAAAAVLTMWRVYSDAALAWTVDFYTRWLGADGLGRRSKVVAAREATLALRDSDPDVVAWAPFIVVGDWR